MQSIQVYKNDQRPKASIKDNDKLYIAKFSSKNDLHSVILWEAVMLELA